MENFATVREGGLEEKQRGIFREGDVRIAEGLVPVVGRRVALFWRSRTRWVPVCGPLWETFARVLMREESPLLLTVSLPVFMFDTL